MQQAKSLRVRILLVAILAMAPVIAFASALAIDEASEAGRLSTTVAWASAAAAPVLLGLAGVLAISIVVETWILRWLNYLERVAKAYGRGRYSIRPRKLEQAPAEFRALGQAVGDMANAVEVRDRELRAALDEQTLLLREVHHRVKNNLQIVGSLLTLQAAKSEDGKVKAALQDALIRLDGMSLAQRFMQADEVGGAVSVAAVFDAWAGQVHGRMGRTGRRLDLRMNVAALNVPLDFASSLVLIANEAVMLAYRHPGDDDLTCCVEVKTGDGGVEMKLWLPAGQGGLDSAHSISKALIQGYVRQLRGQLDIDGGSQLCVQAPLAEAA